MRTFYFLPALLMAAAAPSRAASAEPAPAVWLHACSGVATPGAPILAEAKAAGADGKPLRYVASTAARLPGCTGPALPLPAGAQVETLYPLAPGEAPEATILLHGNTSNAGDGRFAVSEHDLPSNKPAAGGDQPTPMPLRTNLLEGLRARPFGVEERVDVRLENGRLRIACRAGSRAAGVVLTGPWFLTRANLALAARYTASGTFAWQAADAAREAPLDLGALAPAANGTGARLALPAGLGRADWRQFVVLCPSTQATLDVETLALEPVPAAAPGTPSRSTWVWRPGEWIDNGPALLDWAAGQGMTTLFVTVPLKDGAAVRAPDLLDSFVRQAGSRGIAVYSVDGDPHMALADELPAVVRRARAYAAYNASVPPEARLAGMQFDVEPYLLPDNVLPAAERDARYLAMARAIKDVADAAGSLKLEFVVPFWWGGKRELLEGLAPYADALAVMDYRTDPAQIANFAQPFLDWAQAHGRRARIALEAGPIDPEVQRRYARVAPGTANEAGDLLDVALGGRRVLVLLRAPLRMSPAAQAPDGARLYRLAGSRAIDGSATTFHADKAALLKLLPGLERDFSAWDSFGGIAVHELR